MTVALLLGVGFALGFGAIATGLAPARPALRVALARLHEPRPLHVSDRTSVIARLLSPQTAESDLVRRLVEPIRQDLRILGITPGEHVARQLLVAVLGFVLAPATAAVMGLGGVQVGWSWPVAISLVLAATGFLVPSLGVHADAIARRRTFRHALGCYLDLVSIRLAGGAGVETALVESAEAGRGPAFDAIRHALDEARLLGEPPWPRLAQLGAQIGVRELEELAASAELAGDEGARVRASISAKARTIRLRGLTDAESDAQAASERMSLPIVVLMLGFVLFLGYPAVMQVLHQI
jgi:Flp pilus assembly protein TadB